MSNYFNIVRQNPYNYLRHRPNPSNYLKKVRRNPSNYLWNLDKIKRKIIF